jgi:hypothetical protein
MPPPRGLPFVAGGTASLRKVESVKKRFTALDLALPGDRWQKSLTERMRDVDDVRLRAPVAEECTELNIPEGRLSLHNLQSVLHLCGGCVGVRFSGDDFQTLTGLTSTCEALFMKLDATFKALPSASKSRRLLGPYEPAAGGGDGAGAAAAATAVCTHADDVSAGEAATQVAAVHVQIDGYWEQVRRVQAVVRAKNETLPSAEERAKFQRFGKDPDAIEGSASQPQWLTALIGKYCRATGTEDVAAGGGHGHGQVTLGKLSAFLSCVAMGRFACTSDEREAFLVLLHASNDARHMFSHDADDARSFIDRVGCAYATPTAAQQYWASRFYGFLRTLSELKTMKEDERSLHVFDNFAS